MEAQQCAREPTGTNWPTLHETTRKQQKVRLLTTTIRITLNPHPPARGSGQHKRVTIFAVVIVVGKRPETFRTRKLSPQTPMVLHPTECGRVGHRRNFNSRKPLGAPLQGVYYCAQSAKTVCCRSFKMFACGYLPGRHCCTCPSEKVVLMGPFCNRAFSQCALLAPSISRIVAHCKH